MVIVTLSHYTTIKIENGKVMHELR
jgi:hypothetical protein